MEEMNRIDIRQITRFKGKKVIVELKSGARVEGFLAFYNLNDKTIHLNNYVQYKTKAGRLERGQMIIINQDHWLNLKIGEEEVKQ